MSKKPRFSPQRDLIQKIVTKQKGHLSADEIYQKARKTHPALSRATVYRNLQQLEELQLISAMQGPNNVTYYETFAEPHHHFLCKHCKEIRNLDAPNVSVCTACITSKSPVKIETIVTTLFGICEECIKERL